MTEQWTAKEVPNLSGKRFIVTGGNSGIGYEAAKVLAVKGASVIMTVRDLEKGRRAVADIQYAHPNAKIDVDIMSLDLADLSSVRDFAAVYIKKYGSVDVLINNAGVMAIPPRKTVDGFEMQFGTNHLGHFALTGHLMPAILAAPNARVVTVSSGAHTRGKIDFDNLQGEQRYQTWAVYSQSKLANILFAYELQRRFEAAGASAISVAVHPGYVKTNLQAVGPQMSGSRLQKLMMDIGNRLFAGTAEMGALPTLYAAVSPDANGCDYIGPISQRDRHPAKQQSIPATYDPALARRLWDVSEQLTGVHYAIPERSKA